MNEKLVLGLDGGGTSTRAVLANVHGEISGVGQAGSSNYDDIGVEETQKNIKLAVDKAWQQSGHVFQPVQAIFLGMAGVVSDFDRAKIGKIVSDLNLCENNQVGIDHDLRIALAGGMALKPGIVLIAGTGASCYGRTPQGISCRVGGWGHLLDDGGSSYFLGLEALRAAVRSTDGRLGPTVLLEQILSTLGMKDILEIMHRVYFPQMNKTEIASLAPLVLAAAAGGDQVALQIVEAGQNELAALVDIACQRLAQKPSETLLTVIGGLAQSGTYFKSGLYNAIEARLPGIQISEPALPPVLGAVMLAIQLAQAEIPATEVISNLGKGGAEIK